MTKKKLTIRFTTEYRDCSAALFLRLNNLLFTVNTFKTENNHQKSPDMCLPHHTLAACQFIDQESQNWGFLCWSVSLKSFSLQAFSKFSLSTVCVHKNLQNLGNLVSIHTNIQQMFSKSCFGLQKFGIFISIRTDTDS